MNNPKSEYLLSVVVPIKNMSGKLGFIRSWLVDLAEKAIEVNIIVDNSTDDTFNELLEIKRAHEYNHLRIFNGSFGGPGGARNFGLKESTGNWVCFWDSDDIPNADEFLDMVERADQNGASLAIGGWAINSLNDVNSLKNKELNGNYFSVNFLNTIKDPAIWRWAFRSSRIGNIGFPGIMMGEDQVFLANLNIRWNEIFKHKALVYTYIKGNPNQLTLNSQALKDRLNMSQNLSKLPKSIFTTSLFTHTLRFKIFVIKLLNYHDK